MSNLVEVMILYRKLSNINLSYFIGQMGVNTESSHEVLIGYSFNLHSKGKFTHRDAKIKFLEKEFELYFISNKYQTKL